MFKLRFRIRASVIRVFLPCHCDKNDYGWLDNQRLENGILDTINTKSCRNILFQYWRLAWLLVVQLWKL